MSASAGTLILSGSEDTKKKAERKTELDTLIGSIEKSSNFREKYSGLTLEQLNKLSKEIDASIDANCSVIFRRSVSLDASPLFYEFRYHFKMYSEDGDGPSCSGIARYFIKISPSKDPLVEIFAQDPANKDVKACDLVLSMEGNMIDVVAAKSKNKPSN